MIRVGGGSTNAIVLGFIALPASLAQRSELSFDGPILLSVLLPRLDCLALVVHLARRRDSCIPISLWDDD